jgi:hypothetical protein
MGTRMKAACHAVRDAEEKLTGAQDGLTLAREHVAQVRAPPRRDKETWAALEEAAVKAYGENRWWVPKSRKRRKTTKEKGLSVLQVEGEDGNRGGEEGGGEGPQDDQTEVDDEEDESEVSEEE